MNGSVAFSSSVHSVGETVPFNTTLSLTAGTQVVFSVGPNGGLQNTGLSAVFTQTGVGTVSQSYATGHVTGVTNVGGLVGYSDVNASVTSSFWDKQTTGQQHSAGSTDNFGLTTAQFGNTSYFTNAGWTFGSTPGGTGWVIVDTDGSLNNAGGTGATRPMLLSEYSTTITNAHQLELMNLSTSAPHYRLASNIDLSAALTNPADVFGPNGAAGFV